MLLLFYYLSLLNLLDTAFTWFGLDNSLISELNPLMYALYEINPLFFLLAKTSLSVFLLLFIFFKIVPQSLLIKTLTVFATVSYTAVVFMHAFWLIQLV
jgi:hypothetical protein